jgi:hypothetical protein
MQNGHFCGGGNQKVEMCWLLAQLRDAHIHPTYKHKA